MTVIIGDTQTKKAEMDNRKYEVFLGYHQTFWSYLNSYQKAFDILIEDIEKNDLYVDRIAYPMLFMVRHSLELGFKANIRYFQTYSEKNDLANSDSHNLKKLFEGFKIHIKETIKNLKTKYSIEVEKEDIKEFNHYCNEVEKLTNEFEILDNGSFSFRYPIDKSNNKVFNTNDKINLLDVKELFDKAMTLLFHTQDVFSKYIDYANMIEESYEQEMRSNYENYH